MLDVPAELAAIVRTQAVVVAIEGLRHDPLRAVGALLLELHGSRGESGRADRQQPGGRRGDAAALDARLSEGISRLLRNVVGPVEGPTEPELIAVE